jgi:hypothetical protein
MAHVAEECGLSAINFGEGFEAFPLFFGRARFLDSGRELTAINS